MEKISINVKLVINIITLHLNFDSVDTGEVSSKRNVYGFSVDYDAIDKSNILNIHKYLMIKNNI